VHHRMLQPLGEFSDLRDDEGSMLASSDGLDAFV